MTPKEFQEAARALCAKVGPGSEVVALLTNAADRQPIWAKLSLSNGGMVACTYADTFDEILPILSAKWDEDAPRLKERTIKEIKDRIAAAKAALAHLEAAP